MKIGAFVFRVTGLSLSHRHNVTAGRAAKQIKFNVMMSKNHYGHVK